MGQNLETVNTSKAAVVPFSKDTQRVSTLPCVFVFQLTCFCWHNTKLFMPVVQSLLLPFESCPQRIPGWLRWLWKISKKETPQPLQAACVRGQSLTHKVIRDVQKEPLVFQSVLIDSCPGTGHCWEEHEQIGLANKTTESWDGSQPYGTSTHPRNTQTSLCNGSGPSLNQSRSPLCSKLEVDIVACLSISSHPNQ